MPATIRNFAVLLLLAPACTLPDTQLGDTGEQDGGTTTMESSTDASTQTSDTSGTDSTTSDTSGTDTSDPNPNPEPCDGLVQDCPQGFKCAPFSSDGGWPEGVDTGACVPVLGDRNIGEPCTFAGFDIATDDCNADSVCIADAEGVGVCRGFCGDEWTCEPGMACTRDFDTVERPLTVCVPTCDPLMPSDCAEGEACVRYGSYDVEPSFSFACLPTTAMAAPGEPCDDYTSCAPGGTCMNGYVSPSCAGDRCCVPYCMLSNPSCPPGTECFDIFEGTAPPEFLDQGYCTVPDPMP